MALDDINFQSIGSAEIALTHSGQLTDITQDAKYRNITAPINVTHSGALTNITWTRWTVPIVRYGKRVIGSSIIRRLSQ